MANQEHLDLLKQGVDTWNQWRKKWPNIQLDLSRADLRQVTLHKANFHGALQLHFLRGLLPEVSFGENLFSLRERRNVGLESGGHLLQVSESQAFGIAKTVAVALMMDATIGRPIGSSVGP